MKAYKLVKSNMESISVTNELQNNKFAVEYKIGEENKPNVEGTLLFVFKHLEDAYRFMREHGYYLQSNCRLFECETPKLFRFKYMSISQRESSMMNFYLRKKKHKKMIDGSVPLGTYGAKSLTLIKEL